MVEVTGLYVYPVKSLKAIALRSATLTANGLPHDRNWMIVDHNHNAVTQREIPKMATITVALTDSHLILSHESSGELKIDLVANDLEEVNVTIWKDTCIGLDEGQTASIWLNNTLGLWKERPLKLVRYSDKYRRPVEPDHLKDIEAYTAFPDAYPYLITSESTRQFLNTKLISNNAHPITMDRFRPNIVIEGLDAFEEHNIKQLVGQAKSLILKLCKPCQRCKMITIDQTTSLIENPKEPLRTLTELYALKNLNGAFFGENAILLSGDQHTLNIGDTLHIQ